MSNQRVAAALLGLVVSGAPAWALAQQYRHPSSCQDGCMTVSAYRDHGGRTDWNCGGNTYGGHGGTDFATYGGWAAVDEGREVVAAAEGTVVEAHDGEFDRCTSGGCGGGGGWGNYVAIRHADGVVTYYAHQRTGSIAVAVGDSVGCGQHLGFIASSGSSTGPHLHFEPRAGGGFEPFGFGGCSEPSTRWIDQGPYEGLPGTACPVTDRLPEGWIDAAGCDGIRGWANDPDDGAPIDVHVYLDGPAGDPAATGYAVRAATHRDDVGDRGFTLPVPLGFMDGRDHAVFAYGIGAAGGANAMLSGSPATLRCDPPAAPFPAGVRRHVVSPESYAAWRFDARGVLVLDDATLAGFPESDAWPDAPALVRADADPVLPGAVYLRDVRGGRPGRRHVPSPEAMDAWHLDWGAIATIAAAELVGLEAGEAISTRPYLVRGSGPAVYVIDAPPPASAPAGPSEPAVPPPPAAAPGPDDEPGAGSPTGQDAGAMGARDAGAPGAPSASVRERGAMVGSCSAAPSDPSERPYGALVAFVVAIAWLAVRRARTRRRGHSA